MENQAIDLAQQRKGRMMFLAMAIFFTVPLLVVVVMLKYDWRPTSGRSQGEMITPARLITQTGTLQDVQGKSAAQFWLDKWTMVYVAARCEQECLSRLHDMRQIYVSMYKNMPRVQRMLLTTSQDTQNIQVKYPDLRIINQPSAAVEALAEQFNIGQESALQSGRLYFVDPLGHIMMSYPATSDATAVRKDLVKLLRSSWAG